MVSQHYEWRGLRQTRGLRSKTKRVITQFSPHDFTAFNWEGTTSFFHYVTVVLLLTVFLAAELNPFYLKVRGCLSRMAFPATIDNACLQSLLWMEPSHPMVILRLAFVFLSGLPAVRELYQYLMNPRFGISSFHSGLSKLISFWINRKAVRMGAHAWLLLATIVTELLVIRKWGKNIYTQPFPTYVKYSLITGFTLLGVYPLTKVGYTIYSE